MSTKAVIAGMQILLPYYDNPEGFHTGADHDVIYMEATDNPVSPADFDKLVALDWFQESVEDDNGRLLYDSEQGWQRFV